MEGECYQATEGSGWPDYLGLQLPIQSSWIPGPVEGSLAWIVLFMRVAIYNKRRGMLKGVEPSLRVFFFNIDISK